MAKNASGAMYPDVFNNTGPGEEPDTKGDSMYYTYDECMAMQLKKQDWAETPNTQGSEGVLGGPAPGEPQPANLKSPQ